MRLFFLAPAALVALAFGPIALAEVPAAQAPESSEMQERFQVVERHMEAYRSGGLDRFVSTFAHDAIVRADGFVAIGHEQIRALYELNFVAGAPQIKVQDSTARDGKVVLRIAYVTGEGNEWCCSVSEYEITNGKVTFLRTGSEVKQ